jgi:hypothetical protein
VLYANKKVLGGTTPGQVEGMPWLFYNINAKQTMGDTSVDWKFTLGGSANIPSGSTNSLILWLAKYSLEGRWLGWEKVDEQLELCRTLGGGSSNPADGTTSWRRFGSSLETTCRLPFESLMRCGANPVFLELFLENSNGAFVPIPVKILNLVKNENRPNLNEAPSSWYEDEEDENDVFVRRFFLCDGMTAKEGEGAYLIPEQPPRIFRWAAHMILQVVNDPVNTAEILVPILSVLYAERETSQLAEGGSTIVSFKSEYSMDTAAFWTTTLVLFCMVSFFGFVIVAVRIHILSRRCPNTQLAGAADPGIFAVREVMYVLIFFSTMCSVFFWFTIVITIYWLIMFKLQDAPHLLLPSALNGHQYEPTDVMLVLMTCIEFVVVCLALYKQLKTYIFLVDWEKGHVKETQPGTAHPSMQASTPAHMPPHPGMGQHGQVMGQHGQVMGQPVGGAQMYGNAPMGQHGVGAQMYGNAMMGGMATPGGGAQMMGNAMMGQCAGGMSGFGQMGMHDTSPPDDGVSAWRSLFIANELNERLTATRTTSHITWLAMVALLEGLGWRNVARWYPAVSDDGSVMVARFNPFLQLAVGALTWMLVIYAQLIIRRICSIKFGHDLKDFVDVCSIANVSVFFMDEPYLGFYIHGQAPSRKGDWCHTLLLKKLHDEGMERGFQRGLWDGGKQTFEFFIPPELEVPLPAGGTTSFVRALRSLYTDVVANAVTQDVTEKSRLRCGVQEIIDGMVHAVMRSMREVVQERSIRDHFLGLAPAGGVSFLRLPVFYEDKDELAWSSCTAYGNGLRFFGVDIPTGFEWQLLLFEFLAFSIVWRFVPSNESIYFGTALAFAINRMVLYIYGSRARDMLAHTMIVERKFLI